MNSSGAASNGPLFPIDGRHRPMLIGGQWVEAVSGRVMETRNPSTGQVIATVPRGGKADIDRAVAFARAALHGPWRAFKPAQRQALLLRVADLVAENWDEISLSDTLNMGMPIARSRAGRDRIVGMLRFYAGAATGLSGRAINTSLPGDVIAYTHREPIGVVGAIIPWNAPTAATVWKLGPALATGCAVVLKPSEEAPLTPLLLAALMTEAGLPDGVVNVVTGTGGEAGAPLSLHSHVDKVAFTGSTATGQEIVRASAGNLKKVSLELGGKSPIIVLSDADLDRTVPVAATAVLANSGQICIAGSRIFVERKIYPEFVERVADYVRGVKVGLSTDPQTAMGPIVSERQLQRVLGYIESGKAEGARLIHGGERLTADGMGKGYFVSPTVFSEVEDRMKIACEEIFGPVISLMSFDDLDGVLERANDTPYGLAGGVFTNDINKAFRVIRALKAGTVWVNTYHGLDPAVPFGGTKLSGYGREGGIEHLEEYLSTKSVVLDVAE